jgi:hypothetical protein
MALGWVDYVSFQIFDCVVLHFNILMGGILKTWYINRSYFYKPMKPRRFFSITIVSFCETIVTHGLHFIFKADNYSYTALRYRVMVMVFNATFNNISIISGRSELLVEETRIPRENHGPVVSH